MAVSVGDRVVAWRDPGRVTEVSGETASIKFDDGDEDTIDLSNPELIRLRVGERVSVKKWGGRWNGRIASLSENSCHVKFDDNDEADLKFNELLAPVTIELLSNNFDYLGEGGVDERKRFSLSEALGEVQKRHPETVEDPESLRFRVFVNEAGQILLDPLLSVPVRELWLYRNPVALAKVREGLAQAAKGELHDAGSFAKFADDESE